MSARLSTTFAASASWLFCLIVGSACSQTATVAGAAAQSDTGAAAQPDAGAVAQPDAKGADETVCSVDPTQTTWGPDFDGWVKGPVPQDLDAPDDFFKPDAAACAALGIAACRRIDGWAKAMYLCWDANGAAVRPPLWSNEDPLPCTKAQFAQWLEAEGLECAKKVTIDKLPPQVSLLLTKGQFLDAVCANASSTRFRLDGALAVVRVVYWPSVMYGNHDHSGWTTCAAPAEAGVWSAELPYLKCAEYHFDHTPDWAHALEMHSDCASKCVLPTAGGTGGGPDPDWAIFFTLLATNFKGCPVEGKMP